MLENKPSKFKNKITFLNFSMVVIEYIMVVEVTKSNAELLQTHIRCLIFKKYQTKKKKENDVEIFGHKYF